MADNSKLVYGGVFLLFLAYSLQDFFFNSEENATQLKEIPKTSFKTDFANPKLRFLYCYS
ncbi:hypothetical protein IscW_ISCW006092 [Ixodes scapularis]|uniref:Secreted protein n=2 Tax=Ixodes scapularis TaxID=6945 RepID=B7PP76_IXOSC|nr:hypothetical protein IscW_ISCW006092 [Ixodes scapularis]|eukprot:XP_002435568.1 hypothetical protein IscW_ISCW006092 [Ixodes scapularis]